MSRPKKGDEHPKKDIAQQVEVLVAAGTTQRAIISLVGIGSLDTLHKHYSEALEIGAEKANGVIGGVVYRAASKGEPWACQLIAKTRMGWKETNVTELSGSVELKKIERRIVRPEG
jgi:hypothetical protein